MKVASLVCLEGKEWVNEHFMEWGAMDIGGALQKQKGKKIMH